MTVTANLFRACKNALARPRYFDAVLSPFITQFRAIQSPIGESMKTVFSVSGGISQGRGLWVNDTETLAFFGDETTLKMWDPINGVTVLNSKFTELGNITVTGKGNVIATDRGDNTVWKVDATGKSVGDRSKKYGSGKTLAFVDGTSAVTNSLYGVRGVWPLPIDGYLLALHEGCQIIYVDSNDIGHILLNGIVNAHAGDGQWFYSSTSKYKVSEARSVTMIDARRGPMM